MKRSWAYAVAGLIALTFIAGLVFRLTPFYHQIDFERLGAQLHGVQGRWWVLPAVMLTYMLGGLFLFVHVVILWVTVFAFDPWYSVLYCQAGSMASSLFVYGLGRVLRPELVRRLAGSYAERVSQALGRRGKTTLILLHWFPICPFSMLNFLAGSTHIGAADFIIGTWVGITPGIFFISFFGDQVRQAVQHPHWKPFAALILFVALGAATLHWARRRFGLAV